VTWTTPRRLPQATVRGFTIIELVSCLAILSLLALAAMPLSELVVKRQKEQELRRALWEIRGALDAYKRAADEGRIATSTGDSGYPRSLDLLVDGVVPASSASGGSQRLYYLRRIPRDPFFADPKVPASETWVVRSYASPPTSPQRGADVFDVFSSANGLGLNGVPYREW
jgi:general secretion pathway protein G